MFTALVGALLLTLGPGEKFAIVDGYPFVEVRIDGKGPFHMMIDTGASSCSLAPGAAAALGLTAQYRVELTTMTGSRWVGGTDRARVKVGAVEADRVEILLMDPEGVRVVAGADGVLGQSFLGRTAYLIDYRRRRLWLGAEAERQAVHLGPEIPADEKFGVPVLPVQIEGRQWKLVLDTGSNALVIRCGQACWRSDRGASRILTNTGSGSVGRRLVRDVRIGPAHIERAEISFMDGAGGGILPGNWFSAIYVDSARKIIRLAPH